MASANWVKMAATQAEANTNPTTLTAVSGYASFADVFGTSGTRLVNYTLTDGAGNWETGKGVLTLSTLSLDRTWIQATFTGTTYVSEGAVALTTFTAAVTVECSPAADDLLPGSMASLSLSTVGGLGNGFCEQSVTGPGTMTVQGWQSYYPFRWTGRRPITSCSINVVTAGTAGVLLVGLMELQSGGVGNLVFNATSVNGFNPTVTGIQTLVSPTDFVETRLDPGDYLLQIVNNSSTNPQVSACGTRLSLSAGFLGRNSSWDLVTNFQNNVGATTLAQTFSGAPAVAGTGTAAFPDVIFGMAA